MCIPSGSKTEAAPLQIMSVTSPQPDGTYGIGDTIYIHVAFNTALTVTGTPAIALNSGGKADYQSGSNSKTLVFAYSPSTGDSTSKLDWSDSNALSLNGGTVTDSVYGTPAILSAALPALGAASNIVVDTTPPTGSTFTLNNGAYATNSTVVSLAFQYVDDFSTTGDVAISLSEQGWGDWVPISAISSLTLLSFDGAKTVYAKFRDAAGNETAPISRTIILDRVKPTGSFLISGGADAIRMGDAFPLTLTASDDVSAFSDLQVRFRDNLGGGYGAWQPLAAQMTYVNNYGGGIAYVYAEFMDQAGNISTEVSDSIENDPSPPSGSITINNGALGTYSPIVTIAYTASDPYFGRPVSLEIWSSDNSTPIVLSNVSVPADRTIEYEFNPVDGVKTVYMKVTDAAGWTSPVYSKQITLDREAPTGTITIEGGAALVNRNAVQLQITRSGADALLMRFSDDSITWTNWEPYSNIRMYSLPLGDGIKTVYLELEDIGGNRNGSTIKDTIILDTTPPVQPWLTPSTTEPAKEVTITALFSEDSTDKRVQIGSDPVLPYAGPIKLYANALVTAYAADAAGNTSTAQLQITNIDTTPPTGTVQINGGAAWANNFVVTLTLSDGGSGAAAMRFSTDNVAWSAWENYATTKFYMLSAGDGSKAVYVQFRDSAENVSETFSAAIVLDTAPPAGTVAIQGGAALTNSVEAALAIHDGGTGATHMRFSHDNAAWTDWETFSGTKTYTLSAGDGAKTVFVKLKDAAGNESVEPISATIILDTMSPAQPVLTASTTGPTQQVTVSIEYSADSTVKQVKVGAGSLSPYTGPFIVNANAVVTAYAADEAGNTSTAQLYITNIDTTPPSGTIQINGGAAVTQSVEVTLTINDGGTGAVHMQFSNDDTVWTDWEPFIGSKPYMLSAGDGVKTVYVKLKDAAGNESIGPISATILLDTTPPEMISIVAAYSDSTGSFLSVRFDKAVQPDFAIEGLSLSGTTAVLTESYKWMQNGEMIVFRLSPAISGTNGNEVALHLNAETFQGRDGELVLAQTLPVITPYAIAGLKASAGVGSPEFTLEDVVNAMNRQLNVVGEQAFDKYDVQFWLSLLVPVSISE